MKNLYHNLIDKYTNQINDLTIMIKNKDNLINVLKEKEMENINNVKSIIKSKSCSALKFENHDMINENITKLINDNKENKMKIELLNDKIRSMGEIEKNIRN